MKLSLRILIVACVLLIKVPTIWGQDRCCKPNTDCNYELGSGARNQMGWQNPDYSDYIDGGALYIPGDLSRDIKNPGMVTQELILDDMDTHMDELKDRSGGDVYRAYRDKYEDKWEELASKIRDSSSSLSAAIDHNEKGPLCTYRKTLLETLSAVKKLGKNKKSRFATSARLDTALVQVEYSACKLTDYFKCPSLSVRDMCSF